MKIYDPKGNELVSTLLQVIEQDEQKRPTVVRVRYDEEQIGLVEDSIRQFYIVWAPKGSAVIDEHQLKLQQGEVLEMFDKVVARDQTIATQRRELAAAMKDNEEKTIEIRLLDRERDPNRFERAVVEKVHERTAEMMAEVARLNRVIVDRDREIIELRESKRRLKEANERLKDEKKR